MVKLVTSSVLDRLISHITATSSIFIEPETSTLIVGRSSGLKLIGFRQDPNRKAATITQERDKK
jgi:hypothetical protein